MNEHDFDDLVANDVLRKSNQLMHNAQTGAGPGRVAPPMPTTTAGQVPPISVTTTTAAQNTVLPRNYRRISMPLQQYMNSATAASYGGAYSNYPYNRNYMNMNMNMNMGGYSPYSSYGQPMMNQYQNPVVVAAAESSRPAFESIQSVVQSFNAVSMMLESTFTAMHMSFQALLGVAENFTRLRTFMMKLYSTIVSFKLARWFLTKLFQLLRMVRGGRGSNAEEDLWAALSSTAQGEAVPSDVRSWPLVVFTGLLVATPYFVYKLLNSVTPGVSNQLPPMNNVNGGVQASEATMDRPLLFKSPCDWSNPDPRTIPLEKGKTYFTTQARIKACARNNGWLLVEDTNRQKGYAPLSVLKQRRVPSPPLHTVIPEESNVGQSVIPEQIQTSPFITTPFPDVQVDPIVLPNNVVNCDKLEENSVQ